MSVQAAPPTQTPTDPRFGVFLQGIQDPDLRDRMAAKIALASDESKANFEKWYSDESQTGASKFADTAASAPIAVGRGIGTALDKVAEVIGKGAGYLATPVLGANAPHSQVRSVYDPDTGNYDRVTMTDAEWEKFGHKVNLEKNPLIERVEQKTKDVAGNAIAAATMGASPLGIAMTIPLAVDAMRGEGYVPPAPRQATPMEPRTAGESVKDALTNPDFYAGMVAGAHLGHSAAKGFAAEAKMPTPKEIPEPPAPEPKGPEPLPGGPTYQDLGQATLNSKVDALTQRIDALLGPKEPPATPKEATGKAPAEPVAASVEVPRGQEAPPTTEGPPNQAEKPAEVLPARERPPSTITEVAHKFTEMQQGIEGQIAALASKVDEFTGRSSGEPAEGETQADRVRRTPREHLPSYKAALLAETRMDRSYEAPEPEYVDPVIRPEEYHGPERPEPEPRVVKKIAEPWDAPEGGVTFREGTPEGSTAERVQAARDRVDSLVEKLKAIDDAQREGGVTRFPGAAQKKARVSLSVALDKARADLDNIEPAAQATQNAPAGKGSLSKSEWLARNERGLGDEATFRAHVNTHPEVLDAKIAFRDAAHKAISEPSIDSVVASDLAEDAYRAKAAEHGMQASTISQSVKTARGVTRDSLEKHARATQQMRAARDVQEGRAGIREQMPSLDVDTADALDAGGTLGFQKLGGEKRALSGAGVLERLEGVRRKLNEELRKAEQNAHIEATQPKLVDAWNKRREAARMRGEVYTVGSPEAFETVGREARPEKSAPIEGVESVTQIQRRIAEVEAAMRRHGSRQAGLRTNEPLEITFGKSLTPAERTLGWEAVGTNESMNPITVDKVKGRLTITLELPEEDGALVFTHDPKTNGWVHDGHAWSPENVREHIRIFNDAVENSQRGTSKRAGILAGLRTPTEMARERAGRIGVAREVDPTIKGNKKRAAWEAEQASLERGNAERDEFLKRREVLDKGLGRDPDSMARAEHDARVENQSRDEVSAQVDELLNRGEDFRRSREMFGDDSLEARPRVVDRKAFRAWRDHPSTEWNGTRHDLAKARYENLKESKRPLVEAGSKMRIVSVDEGLGRKGVFAIEPLVEGRRAGFVRVHYHAFEGGENGQHQYTSSRVLPNSESAFADMLRVNTKRWSNDLPGRAGERGGLVRGPGGAPASADTYLHVTKDTAIGDSFEYSLPDDVRRITERVSEKEGAGAYKDALARAERAPPKETVYRDRASPHAPPDEPGLPGVGEGSDDSLPRDDYGRIDPDTGRPFPPTREQKRAIFDDYLHKTYGEGPYRDEAVKTSSRAGKTPTDAPEARASKAEAKARDAATLPVVFNAGDGKFPKAAVEGEKAADVGAEVARGAAAAEEPKVAIEGFRSEPSGDPAHDFRRKIDVGSVPATEAVFAGQSPKRLDPIKKGGAWGMAEDAWEAIRAAWNEPRDFIVETFRPWHDAHDNLNRDARDIAIGMEKYASHLREGSEESRDSALLSRGYYDDAGKLTPFGSEAIRRGAKLPSTIPVTPQMRSFADWFHKTARVIANRLGMKIEDRATDYFPTVLKKAWDPMQSQKWFQDSIPQDAKNVFERELNEGIAKAHEIDAVRSMRAFFPTALKKIHYKPLLEKFVVMDKAGENVVGGRLHELYGGKGEGNEIKKQYAVSYIRSVIGADLADNADSIMRAALVQFAGNPTVQKVFGIKPEDVSNINPASRLASGVMKGVAMSSLGLNPGNAARNFLQGQVNTLAFLSGVAPTGRMAILGDNMLSRMAEGHTRYWQGWKDIISDRGEAAKAIDVNGEFESWLHDTFSLMAAKQGGKFAQAWNWFNQKIGMRGISGTEFMNRGVAFYAGARQEMARRGYAGGVVGEEFGRLPRETQDAILSAGLKTAEESQFFYGLANTSPQWKGPLGKTASQFVNWRYKQANFSARQMSHALAGIKKGTASHLAPIANMVLSIGTLSYMLSRAGLSSGFLWETFPGIPGATAGAEALGLGHALNLDGPQKGKPETAPALDIVRKMWNGEWKAAFAEAIMAATPYGGAIQRTGRALEIASQGGVAYEHQFQSYPTRLISWGLEKMGVKRPEGLRVAYGAGQDPPLSTVDQVARGLGFHTVRQAEEARYKDDLAEASEQVKKIKDDLSGGVSTRASRSAPSAVRASVDLIREKARAQGYTAD